LAGRPLGAERSEEPLTRDSWSTHSYFRNDGNAFAQGDWLIAEYAIGERQSALPSIGFATLTLGSLRL
jgi:hypothetical protein